MQRYQYLMIEVVDMRGQLKCMICSTCGPYQSVFKQKNPLFFFHFQQSGRIHSMLRIIWSWNLVNNDRQIELTIRICTQGNQDRLPDVRWIRQVTRIKSKSSGVVKHQTLMMFVVLKTTSNVKQHFKSGAEPLYCSFVTSLMNTPSVMHICMHVRMLGLLTTGMRLAM